MWKRWKLLNWSRIQFSGSSDPASKMPKSRNEDSFFKSGKPEKAASCSFKGWVPERNDKIRFRFLKVVPEIFWSLAGYISLQRLASLRKCLSEKFQKTLRPGKYSFGNIKRTAGKYCCKREYRKATGCTTDLMRVTTTGQNNSNLALM